MAVVKADGYGHGAVQLRQDGAELRGRVPGRGHGGRGHRAARGLGERARSSFWREPPAMAIPLLLAYKVMPSGLHAPSSPSATPRPPTPSGCRAPYHLAVNTGMNRIGVRRDEVVEFMTTGELPPGARSGGHVHPLRHGRLRPRRSTSRYRSKRFIEAVERPARGRHRPRHRARGELRRRHPLPRRAASTWCAWASRCTDFYPCPEALPDDRPAAGHERACAHHRCAAGAHERGRELRHELPQPRQP